MKFLLEFLYCCAPPPPPPSAPSTTPPPAEETRSLFLTPPSRPVDAGRRSRRKGARSGVSRSGSVSEWRPSLGGISEDSMVPVKKNERSVVVGSERVLKRKATPTARNHIQSHRDDCRRAHLSTIIPAFSPTPFPF